MPALEPNLLIVDAAGDRVVSYEGHGSTTTDVQVSGVPAAASGFTLLAPDHGVVFGNQSSTAAGVVEFWHQVLHPGVYTVVGPDVDGEVVPLVAFDATPYAQSALQACVYHSVLERACDYAEVCPEGTTTFRCVVDTATGILDTAPVGLPCGPKTEDPSCQGSVCRLTPTCVPGPVDPGLPCNDDGAPDCEEVVCRWVDGCHTPCNIQSCDDHICAATGVDNDCKPDTPCNGHGEPTCEEYVCQFLPFCASAPCGTDSSEDCATYACEVADCGEDRAPCGDYNEPECVDYLCAAATDDCGAPCQTKNLNQCVADHCSFPVCQNGVIPCGTSDTPTCQDHLCYRIDSDSGCDVRAPPPPGAETECGGSKTVKLAEKVLWTPVAVIHSPCQGSAEVVSGWGNTRSLFVAGSGYESALSYNFALETDTGKTSGAFQLVKWGYFRNYIGGGCTGGYDEGDSYAKIIDQQPFGEKEIKTKWLHNGQLATDADDIVTFTLPRADGTVHESVKMQHQYKQRAGSLDTRAGPGLSYSVTSRTFMQLGITMSFSAGGQNFGASIEGKYSAASEKSAYYLYHVPSGSLVYFDDLGGTNRGMLAFCSPQYTSCA